MKTLLVATDFSKTSLNAVNYAADMALAIHARLEVLHVIQMPVAVMPVNLTELDEEIYDLTNKKLHLLKQKLEKRTQHRVPVVCSVKEGGINVSIEEVAENKKPLAIILGSRGVSNLEGLFFGSVALHTAEHSRFTVFLIAEKLKFKSVSAMAFATNLVFENSAYLFRELRSWLDVLNARLDVIYVNGSAALKTEKEKQFAAFKKHLNNREVYFNYIINNGVADGVSSFLRLNKPDLLVLFYNKKDFFHKIGFRGEFENILNSNTIPFMIIHD